MNEDFYLHFRYLDNTSVESKTSDIVLHGPFFSLCQTLFYIFIFRHKALIEMQGGKGDSLAVIGKMNQACEQGWLGLHIMR